jgi:hypothetical protein
MGIAEDIDDMEYGSGDDFCDDCGELLNKCVCGLGEEDNEM